MDIIEYCGVSRYVHVDFPLGNPCGKPYDTEMQKEIAQQAIDFFEQASESNSILRLPYSWSDNQQWRDNYAAVTDENRESLMRQGEERRQQQSEAKANGQSFLNKIE